jgi:hypothetical protein
MSHFLSRILLYSQVKASNELEKLYLPIYKALNLKLKWNLSEKGIKIFRLVWFIIDIFLLHKFKATLSEIIFGIERDGPNFLLFTAHRILRDLNLPSSLFQGKWIKNQIPSLLKYIEVSYAFLYVFGASRYPSIEHHFTFSQLSFRKLLFNFAPTTRLVPYLLYLLLTPSSEMIINWFVQSINFDSENSHQEKIVDNEWAKVKVCTFKNILLKFPIQKGKCPKCKDAVLDPVACKIDHLVYCKKCLGDNNGAVQIHI